MSKYIVLGYVRNQGKTKGPGTTIELTSKEAAPLLKLKTIAAAPKDDKKKDDNNDKKEKDKELGANSENA